MVEIVNASQIHKSAGLSDSQTYGQNLSISMSERMRYYKN